MSRGEPSLDVRLKIACRDGQLVQAAKSRAERNFRPGTPPSFKRFSCTETVDKLLLGLVKLFHAQLRHISLAVALDKAKRQHLEGVKIAAVDDTIAELQSEEQRHRAELGPVYCSVVLQCSNFQNTVKDKVFFEAFQKFITGKMSAVIRHVEC